MNISKDTKDQLANLFKMGLSFQKQSQYTQAEICYVKILEILPEHADTLHHLGLIKHLTAQHEEALCYIKKAIKLSPNDSQMHFNLGCVYQSLKSWDSAIESYKMSLTLNPQFAMAYNNIGAILKTFGDREGFRTNVEKAYNLNPEKYEIITNYATIISADKKHSEANNLYKKALSINPKDIKIVINLCINLQRVWRHKEAYETLEKAYLIADNFSTDYSSILFHLHYYPYYSSEEIFKKHKDWGDSILSSMKKIAFKKNKIKNGSNLRIAYLSPDLNNHPIAYFMQNIIEYHDKSKYFIVAYCNNNEDQASLQLKPHFSLWRNVTKLTDEELCDLIVQDEIDVLIDLAGHTANNRLMVFAQKPAPLQITYLGYPDTTGLPNMDYRITDQWCDPPGKSDQLHSEKLIRLNTGFLCYKPRENSPPVGPAPFIKNKHITFGCFNNPCKITEDIIELWIKILTIVPSGRLVLKYDAYADKNFQEYIFQHFEKEGISRERIKLCSHIESYYDSINMYNHIDIALDTYPYNGTTTTSEAIWMGVPVITLVGETHVSRVSYSILNQIGLPDLACFSKQDYIDKAVALANDKEQLAQLRNQLRNKCLNSIFTDGKTFTKSLEAVFDQLWKNVVT